jgi:two-component system sensor histidine kinase ComP
MNKKMIATIFVALFIGLQCWFNYLIFNYPNIGIGVEQNRDNQWIVKNFDYKEYSSLLGIRIGDEIKEVNGLDVNEHASVTMWSYIEQARSVLVHRDGGEFEVSLDGLPRLSPFDFIAYCAQIVCFSAAFLLYRRLSYALSARYLTIAILNVGFTFMSLGASTRGDAFGKIFIIEFMALVPYTLLHFLIVFFKEKGGIKLQPLLTVLKYLYAVLFIIFIVCSIFYADPTLVHYIYPKFIPVFILLFLLGILLNIGLLTYLYIKHRRQGSFVSTLVKTVWISLLLSLSPIAIFSFLPMLMSDDPWVDPIYTAWFVILFPLSFTYFIASERLYDIDIILRRIGLTTVLSIIPAGIFAGLMGIVFPLEATFGSISLIFVFTLIVLSFLLYSLEYFITKLEPILFPRKYYLQSSLKKIAINLTSTSNFRDLKANVLVDIVRTLEVFGGAIVFKYKDGVETITEGSIDAAEVESLIALEQLEHPAYTFFVISRHEEHTSYLVMTQKKTNTLLGLEDTQWLNLIISYLAVSLENVYLIRKLTMKLENFAGQISDEETAGDLLWFRKLMFELQEKERYRIATDLHDTTMQDLFFLKRKLTTLMGKYALKLEDQEEMKELTGFIEMINLNLRQSCFELHPFLLTEIGLVRTVEKLISLESGLNDYEIEIDFVGKDELEKLGKESKRHIFRIIQELLNNAKKHSQASHIQFHLEATRFSTTLTYVDDGVGFEQKVEREVTLGASGMGMLQLQSRILYMGGSYEWDTAVGKGVKLHVSFPMKVGATG